MKHFVLAALLALKVSCLSLILQNMEPYCIAVQNRRSSEIRLQYMISGLNEDQVEFRVFYSFFELFLNRQPQ